MVERKRLTLYRTVYTCGIVIDGNFKLAHVKQKRPEDDVWLADGHGMMTEQSWYKLHIITAVEERQVSVILDMLQHDVHGL